MRELTIDASRFLPVGGPLPMKSDLAFARGGAVLSVIPEKIVSTIGHIMLGAAIFEQNLSDVNDKLRRLLRCEESRPRDGFQKKVNAFLANSRSVFAANPNVHAALVDLIKDVMPSIEVRHMLAHGIWGYNVHAEKQIRLSDAGREIFLSEQELIERCSMLGQCNLVMFGLSKGDIKECRLASEDVAILASAMRP